MYTRKQLLHMGCKHFIDFVRTCSSIPSLIKEEDITKDSDRSDHESLFLEAMRLGIDPGTMGRDQLSRTITLLKKQK